jgi:hypothetical protein
MADAIDSESWDGAGDGGGSPGTWPMTPVGNSAITQTHARVFRIDALLLILDAPWPGA